MSESRARYGWESDFPLFSKTPPSTIREALAAFVTQASPEQLRAWSESIPPLQRELDEVVYHDSLATRYSAVLEYELPMESRRADVVLLLAGCVVVLELKGKSTPDQADIDQAAAYARDLSCYHSECAERPVVPVLVPTRARGALGVIDGVHVVGPDALDALIVSLKTAGLSPIPRDRFLSDAAYVPLPSLIEAARELFHTGELRFIKRAAAETRGAIESVLQIAKEAAATRTHRLVLVTGVPGSGKTLVGLQVVHSRKLNDLGNEGAPANAVFLSGNDPLVRVLQHQLSGAGGEGKAFVRHVRDYVKRYGMRTGLVPPENLVVFDEAQRAHDRDRVAHVHPELGNEKNEPDYFVSFAERRSDWSVILALIGSGQEIYAGEEGGLKQWQEAIMNSPNAAKWTVHLPPAIRAAFEGGGVRLEEDEDLSLDVGLRQHLADSLHWYIKNLLEGAGAMPLPEQARRLEDSKYHLRLTRSLDRAKQYLSSRFSKDPTALYGMVASSRDKSLELFGVPNGFNSTKVIKLGPWFSHDDPLGRSCRSLRACVTEFQVQGLELDGVLLAWGTDFIRKDGRWSDLHAKRYKRGTKVYAPDRLRLNTYRVLLTRARETTVVFLPDLPALDETYLYLKSAGLKELA